MIERRRSPRSLLGAEVAIRLELRHRVRLMDISHSGVLMATEATVPVGTRGYLRADLASAPFHAEVAVRRHHGATGTTGAASMGMQFASMDDRSRRHLERFLQRGKE